MLGRAAEGAWIELGHALQQILPATKLLDPLLHIGKRVTETHKLLVIGEG